MAQLSLFGPAPEEPAPDGRQPPAPANAALAAVHAEAAAIAARLPASIRFGTSSWSFPGWRDLVYSHEATPAQLSREGLREYARHPLLRTVGMDRSFYAPVPVDDLRRYADQLPDGFPCCAKAPASVTVAHVREGRGFRANPEFLSAERFAQELLEPFAQAFRAHAGPFLIECSPTPRGASADPRLFLERLDRMLEQLPREFTYAVELRDRGLLTPSYRGVLRRHGVAHVFNYWSAMPTPSVQAQVVAPAEMPFLVVRLLLRPGTWYEDQREKFAPFNRIVEPDRRMRAEVSDLLAGAVAAARPAFVLVNNKAEGSAPLTIRELARLVADRLLPGTTRTGASS